MSKNFYFFAIFFIALAVAGGLLHNLIALQLAGQIYGQEAFVPSFLTQNVIYLLGSFFILKYYHYRKYWFTFSTAGMHVTAFLCFSVVVYRILEARATDTYYIPAFLLFISVGILYALGLMFSNAGKRFWLKTAGAAFLVIELILLSTLILYLKTHANEVKGMIEKVQGWTSVFASLAPILFIMNFLDELKTNKEESEPTNHHKLLYNIWGGVSGIIFIFALAFGIMLFGQAWSAVYWGKKNFEKTQQMATLFEARSFVNNKGEKLRYRLLKPRNYDPQKKYPLVVSLPYGGQPGTDTIRQIEGAVAAEVLSSDLNRIKYPAFIFIPNCPAGAGWGGIPNYPTVDTLVFDAIDALQPQEPGIDVKRCYVTGLSRGGYGSWHFITARPKMFAAAIPVSGGSDPNLASNIVDVPVWAFHGAKDKNVPVAGSRDMIAAITKAGGTPKYTEYPAEGHNIWNKVRDTPGLWDWLFEQKRP